MSIKEPIRRNDSLDLLKGIACILVVLIHRRFPGTFGEMITSLSRPAVALFFTVSGYYAFSLNDEVTVWNICRRVKKIVKILLGTLAFFFIWEVLLRLMGSGWASAKEWIGQTLFSLDIWTDVIVWDYDPLAGHLWFLFALVRVYLIALLLLRIKKPIINVLPYFAWTLIILLEYFDVRIIYYRNGWLYGISFFILGYLLAEKQKHRPSFIIWFTFVCGIGITIIEYLVLGFWQMYLGTILITWSLFSFALKEYCFKSKVSKLLVILGHRYSTVVYILHWAVMDVIGKIAKMTDTLDSFWYRWISPWIVVGLSIGVSIIIYEIRNTMKKRSKS